MRDYFPKGVTDFNEVRAQELARVQDLLNNRPSKTPGYRTPAEALNGRLVATTDRHQGAPDHPCARNAPVSSCAPAEPHRPPAAIGTP